MWSPNCSGVFQAKKTAAARSISLFWKLTDFSCRAGFSWAVRTRSCRSWMIASIAVRGCRNLLIGPGIKALLAMIHGEVAGSDGLQFFARQRDAEESPHSLALYSCQPNNCTYTVSNHARSSGIGTCSLPVFGAW